MRICKACGAAITTTDLRVKTACSPECRRKVDNQNQKRYRENNHERYLVVKRRWIQNNQESIRASERRHAEKKAKLKAAARQPPGAEPAEQ